MRLLGLIALLLIGCSSDSGEVEVIPPPRDGFSFLGLYSPNAREILPQFLSLGVTKISTLWKSFGDDYSSYEEWLQSGEHQTNEVHPFNGPGRRNGRLGLSDFLPNLSVEEFNRALEFHTHDKEIRSWIGSITLFANMHAGALHVRYLLSLGLETNYTPLAAMNLLKIVTEEWPYEIVYNPLDSNDCNYMPSGVYCESHGLKAQPQSTRCIISNDGEEGDTEELRVMADRGRDCIVLFWSGESQGVSEPFVPTLKRKFRFDNVEIIRNALSGM